MAPDLNSIPPSASTPAPQRTTADSSNPNSLPPSRRTSQMFPMNPPPLPMGSPGGLTLPAMTSNGNQPFPPLSPGLSGPGRRESSVDPGPTRLPRAMTPAELHNEMEKEQEAVVNRLTRELNALRAHSASITSTTSSVSTSTSAMENMPGPTHPTSSRRHRSSSTTSQPFLTSNPSQPATTGPLHQGIPSSAIASTPSAMSRQNSTSAIAMSRQSSTSTMGLSASTSGLPPQNITTPRYEELERNRQELDDAKRENERLRRRVRELEALVRGRRTSSVSTNASAAPSVTGSSVAGTESRERSISRRGLLRAGDGPGEVSQRP